VYRRPHRSYDGNGNAITRQGNTIAWSSYNYPTTINAGSGTTAETVAFSYGPDRQRWQQTYTGNSTQETTNYIGGLLEVVASSGVTDFRHYINAGGEQVAVYSRKSSGTNTLSYLLSDHQASVASITNSSGAQVVGESFDAFGSRRNPSTWSGPDSNADLTTIAGITREGYTFQTALGLWMGMNHMNGRVEDSITGRMLSADPTVPANGNSQSYNRYSYVYNNPHSSADPSGFIPCPGCKPIDGPCRAIIVPCIDTGGDGLGTGQAALQNFMSAVNGLNEEAEGQSEAQASADLQASVANAAANTPSQSPADSGPIPTDCDGDPAAEGTTCTVHVSTPGPLPPAWAGLRNAFSLLPQGDQPRSTMIPQTGIADVRPTADNCSFYNGGGTGAGHIFYSICANTPDSPWWNCARGGLLDEFDPNGSPGDMVFRYLVVDHPKVWAQCAFQ
jgi:RHS repeat-associated protein